MSNFYETISLGKTENPVECELNISNENEIKKILSVSSVSEIDSYEVLQGQVNYNGKIVLNVVYLNQNDEIDNEKISCVFSQKFQDEKITLNDEIEIDSNVLDVKIDRIKNNNVKMFVITQNKFYSHKNCEIKEFQNKENFCIKNKQISFDEKVFSGTENFTENASLETKQKVKKVLNLECKVVPKVCESSTDFIVVEGEILSTIFYATLEEESKLIVENLTTPFREEFECVGACKDWKIKDKISVKNEDVSVTLEEKETGSNIALQIPIKVETICFASQNVDVVCDLYSTKFKTENETENLKLNEYLGTEIYESKIEGNVTLDLEQPRIDKLLAVDSKYLTESNSYIENGYLIVEGVVYSTLIYLTDEEEKINSLQVEIPFMIKEKAEYEDSFIRTISLLCDSDINVRKGREILFDGKVKTIAVYYSSKTEKQIVETKCLEEIEKRNEAIEIFFAEKGQTFWDISKEGKVLEEVLKSQNPEIQEPFEKPEKIVYFEKKEWKENE